MRKSGATAVLKRSVNFTTSLFLHRDDDKEKSKDKESNKEKEGTTSPKLRDSKDYKVSP
jgi:hypothetical protein